jgi:hypothetical protein
MEINQFIAKAEGRTDYRIAGSVLTFTTPEIESLFLDGLRSVSVPLNINHFQQAIAESTTKLSQAECEEFDCPVGTTVGHLVRSTICFFREDGKQICLSQRISFKDENQSLLWWRNNKANPHRLRMTYQEGKWRLEIAPITGSQRSN